MVLEIAANALAIGNDADAEAPQRVRRPHAG
jgi:hypothetical protein